MINSIYLFINYFGEIYSTEKHGDLFKQQQYPCHSPTVPNLHQDPLLITWFHVNPSMDINYIHYKEWDEITYPWLHFNGATVEV